ncbi:MAG: hypothetical protein RIF41_21475 [Polyangiaceae bacterium]
MAEWQDNELAGLDIAYVIGGHSDVDGNSIEADEIVNWPAQHGFDYSALVLDNGRVIADNYIDANPGPTFTEAVVIVLDAEMRIVQIRGTYDQDDDSTLQLLLQLAQP